MELKLGRNDKARSPEALFITKLAARLVVEADCTPQSYRLARYKPVGKGSYEGRVKPIWLPNKYVLHAQK